MRSHPNIAWILIAAALTSAILYPIWRLTGIDLMIVYLVAINIVTFMIYRHDKRISPKRDAIRVPNKTLMALAALGGSIGALLGMYILGHKTSRKYFWFRVGIWVIVVINLMIIL